jgi:hypothetical protein
MGSLAESKVPEGAQVPEGARTPPPVWVPATEPEREAVRQQVGRILASSLFRNSKRFPNLLRYTVEHTLNGDEPLKERTLGVEVFGREPSYDTTQDPVVRMTAVEIRKRLARYYQLPEHSAEIRIDFPQGSYLPEFHLAPQPAAANATAEAPTPVRARRWRPIAAALIAAAGLVIGAWASKPWTAAPTASDLFWKPIVHSASPVLLCVADARVTQPDLNLVNPEPPLTGVVNGDTTVLQLLQRDTVRFSNALTLSMLTGFLSAHAKPFHIRRTGATALSDLREGPVILIGLTDNPWTLRLSNQLRFSFGNDGGRLYIKDRRNPLSRKWGYDGLQAPLRSVPEAHGIVSRFLDPTTGRLVVTAAGLLWGTRAAGECLTDPACLAEAARLAPGDWSSKNIQVVISAKVIGESAGPPHVVAAHLW